MDTGGAEPGQRQYQLFKILERNCEKIEGATFISYNGYSLEFTVEHFSGNDMKTGESCEMSREPMDSSEKIHKMDSGIRDTDTTDALTTVIEFSVIEFSSTKTTVHML